MMKWIQPYQKFFESEQIYTNHGDPYEYKVTNDHWLAKRKENNDWFEITGSDYIPKFQVSIDYMDEKFPDARSLTAPNRQVKTNSNQTPLKPATITGVIPNEQDKKTTNVSTSAATKATNPDDTVEVNLPDLNLHGVTNSDLNDLVQNKGGGREFDQRAKEIYEKYKFDSKVFWAVFDLDKGDFLATSPNSDTPVYAASVSKVVTAACALNKWNCQFPDPRDFYKLKKLLINSWNHMWDRIGALAGGPQEVNKWAQEMGWSMLPGRVPGKNTISAHSMCLFWRDTFLKKYNGADLIIKVTNSCATGSGRARAYIPSNCYVGNKTGTMPTQNHDSAWIITPKGKYTITVLTNYGGADRDYVGEIVGGLFRQYCNS